MAAKASPAASSTPNSSLATTRSMLQLLESRGAFRQLPSRGQSGLTEARYSVKRAPQRAYPLMCRSYCCMLFLGV